MKKLFMLLTILLLSVSLFASVKNTLSAGLSFVGINGIEEKHRNGLTIGAYADDKLVFGERRTYNMMSLIRSDASYAINGTGSFDGGCWDLFSGAGVLVRPFDGFELEACLGGGLFVAISDDPIFDLTAGVYSSLGYGIGDEESIILSLSSNIVYGILFHSVYYTVSAGAGFRF